eukprot:5616-Heterococcus_DN1.PRE.5
MNVLRSASIPWHAVLLVVVFGAQSVPCADTVFADKVQQHSSINRSGRGSTTAELTQTLFLLLLLLLSLLYYYSKTAIANLPADVFTELRTKSTIDETY